MATPSLSTEPLLLAPLRYSWNDMSSHCSAPPDALLMDLYASTAEPARWPRALDQLCLETGACSAAAIAVSFDEGCTRIHWSALDSRTGRIQFPLDGKMADSSNLLLHHRRALRGLNRVVRDEELFDPGDEARTRVQQQRAALGMGHFLGSVQEVSPGVFLVLGLNRAIDDRLDFSTVQAGRVAAVMPHLGRAFALIDPLQPSPMYDCRPRELLDRLRCGMVFCDAEGRVDWLNRSAEHLLAAGPLRLIGSRLLGDSEAETTKLMNELARAGSAESNTVRYLHLGWDERVLHVAIQPAAHSSTVVLTLTLPSRAVDIPTDALIQLFNLTPTEACLVAALATGSTLEQYAQQRGASVATARVQLKHVQKKTGARRQSDLVRLVWSSVAAHLSPGFADPTESPILRRIA